MRRAARLRVPHEFERSGRRCSEEPLCRISYLKPVEGCPVYTEYFKEGDDVPSRLCPIHQGTRQAARPARGRGLLLGLGKRILRGIFK